MTRRPRSPKPIPVDKLVDGEGFIYLTEWHRQSPPPRDGWQAPWFRVYRDRLHQDAYVDLTWPQRGLLATLEMVACERGNGALRYSSQDLTRLAQGRYKHGTRILKRLIEAGFVEVYACKLHVPDTDTDTEKAFSENGNRETPPRPAAKPEPRPRNVEAAVDGRANCVAYTSPDLNPAGNPLESGELSDLYALQIAKLKRGAA